MSSNQAQAAPQTPAGHPFFRNETIEFLTSVKEHHPNPKEIGNPRLVVETIDKRIRNVYLDDIPDDTLTYIEETYFKPLGEEVYHTWRYGVNYSSEKNLEMLRATCEYLGSPDITKPGIDLNKGRPHDAILAWRKNNPPTSTDKAGTAKDGRGSDKAARAAGDV